MSSAGDPRFLRIGAIPLEEAESTLDDSCEAMIGRKVYVGTVYGYGWGHRGHNHYPGYPGVPEPFHARVERFYAFRANPRRGFFGVVEEPGHRFDGFRMVCCTRHVGRF